MNLSIRDPKAHELARELAERRGLTLTEATIEALQLALEAERKSVPLATRLHTLATELAHKGKPGGHRMTKQDIDAMWQS